MRRAFPFPVLRAQARVLVREHRVAIIVATALLIVIAAFAWLVVPAGRLLAHFKSASAVEPSRLYAAALRLERGQALELELVLDELSAAGYLRQEGADEPTPGRFVRSPGRLSVHLRRFPSPNGHERGGMLEIRFANGRLTDLQLDGRALPAASLEPPLLASFYRPDRKERRHVRLAELPEHVTRSVLAAEDDGFFGHTGVSLAGILRAAWVNVRGGAVRQGGSTLTQQLVKNLYLSHERTYARKAREAVMAIALELGTEKAEILEAYLNEVYLGARDGVNLIGIGAAARAFFGKDADQLSLAEAATLAGMISSPAGASPLTHPERALTRRNWVLARMRELGWAELAALDAARSAPLELSPQRLVRRAPYFAEAVRRELDQRWGVTELEDAGLTILSTLSMTDQQHAEEAVARGLRALEQGWERRSASAGPLQAALVSLAPEDGRILAYVGGRSWAESQFDRAGSALRQAGSAFKPVVYAAAIDAGLLSPATLIEDEPLTLALASGFWTPDNDDRSFLGLVSARSALEQSRNLPTVRVAMLAGLEPVVALARRLGITGRLEPVPALALGAFELSPLELVRLYATFAAGGLRPGVHGVHAVLDGDGRALTGAPPPAPEQALRPEVAYLVTSMLQGAVERGTGRAVRAAGLADPVAGKTGTSNDRRDSWFCGFAAERATVVWVGYDDNSPTNLSGARAAAPIWGRFSLAVRPAGGYRALAEPPGLVHAVIDPATGELATEACPEIRDELFLTGYEPRLVCHLHQSFFAFPVVQPEGVEVPAEEQPGRFRRFLRKVFGRR